MKFLLCSLLLLTSAAFAQDAAPVPGILSTPGPLFTVLDSALSKPVDVIAYGDTRFTDPKYTEPTNPTARRELVARIAELHPDALLISGDLPWRGGVAEDYAVFRSETAAWRAEGLRVYPALGNHEFSKCAPEECLENWWGAFPEIPQLRNRRWYATQIGSAIYALSLDSDTSLLPGSVQREWLEAQIAQLPKSVRFVLLNLHHPPVADIQTVEHVDHNPRPNEMALRDYLEKIAPKTRARFVVIAGHIHNYERFEQGGVTYFVSGGGGAQPYAVVRKPADLYQDPSFPNYHYIQFTLKGSTLRGQMVRLENPNGGTPVWKVKDRFDVRGR